MNKKIAIVGILAVVVIVVLVGVLGSGNNGGLVTSKPKSWQDVTTFSGVGSRTSSTFYVPSNEWRITYEYTGANEYAGMILFVYPKGETVMYTDMIMPSGVNADDTSYIYDGPGEYYVDVSCANLESWKITVEALF